MEFRVEDCTELVIYVADDEPLQPGTPSFWAVRHSGSRTGFAAIAECGPFPCLREKGFLLDEICLALEVENDRARRSELWELMEWIEAADATHFDVQLEPPAVAGQGTARVYGIATFSEWDVRAGALHLRSGRHKTIWRMESSAPASHDVESVDDDAAPPDERVPAA